MDDLHTILEDLERRDVHRTLKTGMPEEIEKEIKDLCASYRSANPEDRAVLKRRMSAKQRWMILHFASRMAELAMQVGDKEAIDLGLVAFDLSNIMNVDFRDAFGSVGTLAFAARRCGVDIVDRAKALIPDTSDQLLLIFQHPKEPRTLTDSKGNLVFRNTGADSQWT